MSLEKNALEKKDGMNVLRSGLVAASLMGAVEHDRVEAAEIQPGATWEEGVSEMTRSVREDPAEHTATFVAYADGTYEWFVAGVGTQKGVFGVPSDLLGSALAKHSGGKPIERLCDMHTHNKKVIEEMYEKFFGKPIIFDGYVPPGAGEISDLATAIARERNISSAIAASGARLNAFEAAIFDPRGVWYFRYRIDPDAPQFTDDEFVKHSEELKNASSKFTIAAMEPGFNFEMAYKDFTDAYAQKLQTTVRFVPYENLKDEPPCAGSDYIPMKKID